MGNYPSSTDNTQIGHDEFNSRQRLYESAKKDDVYEFSHYFALISREYQHVLNNIDFISWLISISIKNNSINVLKYITLQDKKNKFLSDNIFKELLLEQLDGHEILNFSIIKWMKSNYDSLKLTDIELESFKQNISKQEYKTLLEIFKQNNDSNSNIDENKVTKEAVFCDESSMHTINDHDITIVNSTENF
jgi:hypothetical protein